MEKVSSQLLVIFGASGDLTGRKLLPSLFTLFTQDLLPEHFCILGAARTPYSDEQYREFEKENILTEMMKFKAVDSVELEKFLDKVYYLSFDSTSSADYYKLHDKIVSVRKENNIPDNVIYYLATPPKMYEVIPSCLKDNKMNLAEESSGWRRIIIEKPFGLSLATAQALNKHLSDIFPEQNIYRIDHYLGKETVQNILVLRFSNGIFEPLWNRNYIDSVVISATETLGVENRAKYYDETGALRDMIQNHLMQLMAFTAMEAPSSVEPEPMRDEVMKVFRSLRPYTIHEMNTEIVRGQYIGYREESNIPPDSNTATYVAVKMFIDNWRWKDVPFFIITGKKMPEKVSEIVINFKSTPHQLFRGQCAGGSCNKLIIRIQPDESIILKFGLKMPGAGFTVEQVGMDFHYDSLCTNCLPDAYERLLLDAMQGDSTLYARSDALEASWKIIDPILNHWHKEGEKNLFFYEPGTDGPLEKSKLGITPAFCTLQKIR